MSTRRRRIAEHLLEAQHATAHLTTFNEVDMSAVVALRERLKEPVEKQHGIKLTYMPFFARAASMALEAYPVVNAQIATTSTWESPSRRIRGWSCPWSRTPTGSGWSSSPAA
jgi:2-oxoglutarate dehydrogenase E2 component (dihydrolipoamide succinyltransferase)